MNNPISLSVVYCKHVACSAFAVLLGLALLLAQSAAFATPPPCDGTENYTQVITVTSPANNTVFASGTTSATVTFTYSGYSSYLGATWALTSNGTTSQTGTVASTTQSFTISGLGAANYSLDITPKNGTLGAGCTVAKTDGIVAFSIAASAPPNAAQFISQSVPSSMVTGQVYPVSVTMKNTGTNTWTSAAAYSLGSQNPISNSTWGANRFALPASVAPGATATISINVTAPTPGSYNFQSQMVQDGVAWFGDYSTNVVVAVAKQNQTISFGTLANKLSSDAPFAVSATVSSGLGISFSSLTTPVCTVSGTTITLVSVGSCSIAADQAGNATYNAAPQVVQSFTVAPPPPTVSLTTQSLAPIAPARIKFNAIGSAGVVKLEFIANNSVIFTKTTASSYTYMWEGLGAGAYNLQVRATDSYNATVTSPVQTITIAAAPTLPAGNTGETRTSIFDYDPVTGVLIKEVIEPNNPDMCLVTVYTQESYGNVATKTTRNCNGSGPILSGAYAEGAAPAPGADSVFTARSGATVYDNRGQFPTTVTNALNQSETHIYDARFGTRLSLTGPNGLTTTWVYDGYGRTVQENRADGTYSTTGYPNPAGSTSGAPCTGYGQWTYNQTTICYQITSISYSSTGAQIGQPVYTYLDQANRKLFSTRINFANTDWIDDGLTYYDALGRVDKTFRPYERNTWPAKNAVLAIKNYYDVLGRVTEAHDFFTGSDTLVKSASYSALVTQTTVYTGNQSPQTTIATKNVAGQTALVEDPAGGRIRYAYDANSNLIGTDANGILNTVSYDLRGRKTGMADADMGSWSYNYNALGELIRQVDALSQTTTLQYDVLGRMTRRTEGGLDSKWEFDANRSECASSAANNKVVGKLTAAFTLMADGVTANSTRISCYDSLGRSSRELTTLTSGGTVFTSGITYDTAGRVDTSTSPAGPSNPAGFAVRNVYNAQGYPSQLVRVSTSAVLWQGNGVDAFGHITNETMGNGLVTQRTYDDRGRSMLVTTGTTQTVNTASALQYNGATYNNIDQVLQRNWVNAGATISETYTYDDLNQITAVASSLGGLANKTPRTVPASMGAASPTASTTTPPAPTSLPASPAPCRAPAALPAVTASPTRPTNTTPTAISKQRPT